jgi:hemolysin activation/secretion protein
VHVTRLVAITAAACAALAGSALDAQVVERHLPAIRALQTNLPALPAAQVLEDDRPIGPILRAIAVTDADEPMLKSVSDGVHVPATLPRSRRLSLSLCLLIGQPLSLRLIARAEALVTQHYRAAGLPFVAVSTPEQELTGGILQVRVTQYRVGSVFIRGVSAREAGRLRDRIRLMPGAPVSSWVLAQDLDWLNRYPFRHVEASFTPSAAAGATDVTLNAARGRPWQAYGGYATSDAPSTGASRLYAGILVGDLLGRDSITSVQATTSSIDGDPRYFSIAAQVDRPIGARSDLELSIDGVRTHREADTFAMRTTVREAGLVYRWALPASVRGNARIGVQARWFDSTLRFGGEPVFDNRFSVYQFDLGYDATIALPRGQAVVDVALHISPGGIGSANSADKLFFGRSRTGAARYAYATIALTQDQRLGRRLGWNTQLVAQIAGATLPATEQAGLGGSSLVRGYTLDDGAFDRMVLIRNALTLSFNPQPNNDGRRPSAYGFVDGGAGEDLGAHRSGAAASAGAGLVYPLFGAASLKVEAAKAMIAQGSTHGSVRLWGRFSIAL